RKTLGKEFRKRFNAPERAEHAKQTATAREQQTLDEHLSHNGPTSCAERGPNRDLLASHCRLRQKQIRDVRTRDQQHEPNRAKQNQHRQTQIADVVSMQRARDKAETFVCARVFSGQSLPDPCEIGIRALNADAGLQTSDQSEIVIAASTRLVGLHGPRRPQLSLTKWKEEAARHYADDRIRFSIKRDVAIDDRGIAIEASLPERVTQNNHVLLPRLIFIREERAAECRRHA